MRQAFFFLMTAACMVVFSRCNMDEQQTNWVERQVTDGPHGHFINPVQAFSYNDRWIVYDTRNDGGGIGRTPSIERVDLKTGAEEVLFKTEGQTEYGPGVGAAACAPDKDQVIFIKGLQNCDAEKPYNFDRRTGAGVRGDKSVIYYDARDVTPPFTPGALRGGTHAHSWSADGEWITFTYNDAVMSQLAEESDTVEDLRMVGVMAPWGRVEVPAGEEGENIDGAMFSMVISRVTERPEPGSDEISKAYEDGWIGQEGYLDADGNRIRRSVAFLGDVRTKEGETVTEVFVADLPEEKPDLSGEDQIRGGTDSRPLPLSQVRQRRVTYTADRKYPGVQGPRQWMKSTPDGSELLFMMKDDEGIVQICKVSVNGGEPEQITRNDFSAETSFDLDSSGEWLAYGAAGKLYRTNLHSGKTECLLDSVDPAYSSLHSVQWSRRGMTIAYNRRVAVGDTNYYQIFTLSPE